MQLDKTTGTTVALDVSPQENAFVQHARDEAIRTRAHEIVLERGGQDGFDVDDWLKAEIDCFG